MKEPVDLTNLRSMTDGDAEMEKALFEEFITSFEAGIASMGMSLGAAQAETWRSTVHGLKGIAFNLGAEALGELCKKGQDEYAASEEAKRGMLGSITQEYQQVKQFLTKVIAGLS